jgi:hypothetical protein
MAKTIKDFFQSADDRTYFIVYRKFLLFVLLYLLKEKCYDDVHGWDMVEKSFEFYRGTAIAGNTTTEKAIILLHRFGVITPLYYCPTLSQKAFTGLVRYNKQYLKKATSLASFPTAGFVTHFKFQVNKKALDEVLLAFTTTHDEV